MISNRKVLSESIVYTISGLLIKCFGFFLLPLYTAFLTTSDYGITSIANSFIQTMSFIVALSLYSAVVRFYVDYKDNEERLRRFYGTVVSFVFLSGLAWGLIGYLFKDWISSRIFSGVTFYPVILITLISLIFNCEYTVYENVLRSQHASLKCSILSICYFLLTVGLNIAFVVYAGMGATGVLLASLISSVVYTVFFVLDMVINRKITFCIDIQLLKEALKYSIPIMPHNLSPKVAELVSKVLIGGTSTIGVLGVFSIATQFGTIADTVQGYVNIAYGPWLFERLHDHDEGYKTSIRAVAKMLCMMIGLLFLGIALFSQDYILLFLHSSYAGAWQYVPFIVAVYTVKTIYYFYVNILFYFKSASRKLFIATLSASMINVVLSFFLIKAIGAYGSVLADGIAMVVQVIIVIVMSRKYEDIGLRLKDFVFYVTYVMLFIFAGLAPSIFVYKETFSVYNFVYKVIVVCVYVLFMIIIYRKQLFPLLKELKCRIGARRG
jgi:O-antigen/teichoic acid export membrane protein